MPKTREQRYLEGRELRAEKNADGSRTISGYAIRYNEPSRDLGGFTEIVAPGAATDSLRDNPDIVCLRDHDSSILLGRSKSGTLKLMDDPIGLRFICNLPDTTQAADLAASIDRGDLDGVSFGFTTIADKWSSNGGNVVRTLLKINLAEISPCSFPAYPGTSVSVRSCPKELRSQLRPVSDDLDADEDDICECDCPECQAGDCEDCTNPDFDHDESRSLVSRSEQHRMHMRLALASHRL